MFFTKNVYSFFFFVPIDRFQRQKSFQYKKYDLQSFLMMLVLLLLLCENVLSFTYIINYGFLTTETNLKALYIFRCYFTTSSVKQFVVTVQIFVYRFLFTIVFFGKRKKPLTKSFTFWKWKHISKKNHILETKAHFKTHFENENVFIFKIKS